MTLYTLFHLHQLDTHDAFVRQLERHDGASLTAFAFHEPKTLVPIREDFLTSVTPVRAHASDREAIIARAQQMVAAHRVMRPIPPPESIDGPDA